MNEPHDDERFVHRLEAFSDVVIGFTLAQIGAALVLPHHASDLISNPFWLFTFVWTFAVVCLMWWLHNRLFRTFFAPTPVSIVANFCLLAAIVVLVYFAEVMVHAASTDDFIVAQRLYNGALGVSCFLLGLLTYLGARYHRHTMDDRQSQRARRVAIVNASAALVLFVAIAATLIPACYAWAQAILGYSIPLAFLVGRFAARAGTRAADAPA